jgi:hypothetical protein
MRHFSCRWQGKMFTSCSMPSFSLLYSLSWRKWGERASPSRAVRALAPTRGGAARPQPIRLARGARAAGLEQGEQPPVLQACPSLIAGRLASTPRQAPRLHAPAPRQARSGGRRAAGLAEGRHGALADAPQHPRPRGPQACSAALAAPCGLPAARCARGGLLAAVSVTPSAAALPAQKILAYGHYSLHLGGNAQRPRARDDYAALLKLSLPDEPRSEYQAWRSLRRAGR